MTVFHDTASAIGDASVSRRRLLQWSAAAGGTAALSGCGLVPKSEPQKGKDGPDTKVFWSACTVNCGSRCPLMLVVKDGTIVRVDPEPTGDDKIGSQQIRACVRGRSIRQRIYSPERLKKPLMRVGKRGEDKWQEISWDEAMSKIAETLKRLIKEYGNESIYLNYGTGVIGATVANSWPPAATAVARLMNCVGGFLNQYNDYSCGNIEAAVDFHYGAWQGSNSNDDLVNSKLVVMFGNNPHETRMSGGGEVFVTRQVKEKSGQRVIMIDPRYTDTAMNLADEWVPIRPGTDTALVAGIAHVLIKEKLVDREFLNKYTSGFDEAHMPEGVPAGMSYESYVLGKGPDGIEKTPAWASKITGYPAADLIRIAREIGRSKPCSVNQGWGMQRHSNGENQSRAPMLLAALIGQIGISGGGTGERESSANIGMAGFPVLENPVKPCLPFFRWTDAIVAGKGMTYKDGIRDNHNANSNANVTNNIVLKSDIKFIWNYGSNALINQHSDINKTIEILSDESKCEMIVVIDNQMTVSARYADIVLPDVTTAEHTDIIRQGSAGNLGYSIIASQAIEPLYDSMPVYEQLTLLAEKLGVKDKFTEGRTQEQWLRFIHESAKETIPDLPSFDKHREMGIIKKKLPSVIGMKAFRDDPEANPLGTPSGKIEIFSSNLYKMSQDWPVEGANGIDPLPIYRQTREMPGDPLQEKYPLQCIGHHYKQRTHSSYGNSPWLNEAHPQMVWINELDATSRGIVTGDMVEVFNDHGRLQLPAYVTKRIMPGVMSVPQGAWYRPKEAGGVDVGGAVNVLTTHFATSYAKANGQHSVLAEVKKV